MRRKFAYLSIRIPYHMQEKISFITDSSYDKTLWGLVEGGYEKISSVQIALSGNEVK
jgi:hypothetical protein